MEPHIKNPFHTHTHTHMCTHKRRGHLSKKKNRYSQLSFYVHVVKFATIFVTALYFLYYILKVDCTRC